MNWVFHNVNFAMDDCDYLPEVTNKRGPWSGHRRFAYDLVRFMKPRNFVELGSFYGTSFFSFCQGVKDEGLLTKCYAIDTWNGDPHSGFYGNEVYQAVADFVNQQYLGSAALMRTTFDEAVNYFDDDSIDLLHIDGYHTYDAVMHDYEMWHRKLALNGIILFHDIAVKALDFGVYKLWEQLKQQYPHIEFQHSFGLGVLFPKGCNTKCEILLSNEAEFQKVYG